MIAAADFQALPQVLSAPDQIAFGDWGTTGRRHVTFAKAMGGGALLVIKNSRRRRKQLAFPSMKNKPAAIDADRLPRFSDPNVRSDSRNAIRVFETPTGASPLIQA